MQLKYRIGSAVASTALLASVFAPVASAAVTVEVSGNAKKSDNTVTLNLGGSTSVNQSNTTKVTTNTKVKANTGKNKANGNTGAGDNDITTGDVTTAVTVGVTGNVNSASMPDCGCDADLDVMVTDNGKKTKNTVLVNGESENTVDQKNKTKVTTKSKVKANTGKNKTNDNTGEGSQTVETGVIDTTVDVAVEGGANTL